MKHPIVRMYASSEQANNAVRALKECGFSADIITVVSPSQGADIGAIVKAIAARRIALPQAKAYAQKVAAGATFVAIDPPFGSGMKAQNALDRFAPMDTGIPVVAEKWSSWDEAAPLSSALRLPTVIKSTGSFSGFFHLPTLSRSNMSSTRCKMSSTPFSSFWKLPLLSKNATPLSSKLKLPVLSDMDAPLSKAMGVPTISDKDTIFPAPSLPTLKKPGKRR